MCLSSYLFVASEVGNSRKTFPLGVCGPLPNYQNLYLTLALTREPFNL